MAIRSENKRCMQNIIQKSDQHRRRNFDFELIPYSFEEFKKYVLMEMDTTDVKRKNLHKQYNIIENTLQAKDFLTEEEKFRELKEEAIKDGIVRKTDSAFVGSKMLRVSECSVSYVLSLKLERIRFPR
jgi:transcription antitermination factor NusG